MKRYPSSSEKGTRNRDQKEKLWEGEKKPSSMRNAEFLILSMPSIWERREFGEEKK